MEGGFEEGQTGSKGFRIDLNAVVRDAVAWHRVVARVGGEKNTGSGKI